MSSKYRCNCIYCRMTFQGNKGDKVCHLCNDKPPGKHERKDVTMSHRPAWVRCKCCGEWCRLRSGRSIPTST